MFNNFDSVESPLKLIIIGGYKLKLIIKGFGHINEFTKVLN